MNPGDVWRMDALMPRSPWTTTWMWDDCMDAGGRVTQEAKTETGFSGWIPHITGKFL